VAGTNLNTATLANAFYTVNGQCVQVYAAVDIDADTAAFIAFTLSLPFGIDITSVTELIGHTSTEDDPHLGGTVQGAITSNLAAAQGQVSSTGANTIYLYFAYVLR
jgi:hypothetical protein